LESIAQTNLQLYNQLCGQGRSLDELITVHRAYEFLTTIYPGLYQADGKPFVAHGVGVASVLGHLGLPVEFVAAGLLHNIYGNGDFGDGRTYVLTEPRRRLVRNAVGDRIETLISRLPEFRISHDNIRALGEQLDSLDAVDRALLLIDLADWVEKYVDLGVLYFGSGEWVTSAVADHGDMLIDFARRLDQPMLAAMLAEAFAGAAAADVPRALRAPDGRQYLKLVVPRSCRLRLRLVLRRRMDRAWSALRARLRPRTRLREFRRAMGQLLTSIARW
jgi:hypothetical protein